MKLFEFFGVPQFDENGKDPRDKVTGKTKHDDEKLSDELFWYILDNDQLHKECFLPIAREIAEKQKSGKFDHREYIEKWMPMVNKGCLKYYKEHEMIEDPRDLFTKEMRKGLCQRLADQHHRDIESNEYRLG